MFRTHAIKLPLLITALIGAVFLSGCGILRDDPFKVMNRLSPIEIPATSEIVEFEQTSFLDESFKATLNIPGAEYDVFRQKIANSEETQLIEAEYGWNAFQYEAVQNVYNVRTVFKFMKKDTIVVIEGETY